MKCLQGNYIYKTITFKQKVNQTFPLFNRYPPFFDDNPFGIYEKILGAKVHYPSHIDPYAKDLIKRLLAPDRTKRLGNLKNGANDVKNHKWFRDINWALLLARTTPGPIIPSIRHSGDTGNFEQYKEPTAEEQMGDTSDPFRHLFQDF
jgi:protein kinase X